MYHLVLGGLQNRGNTVPSALSVATNRYVCNSVRLVAGCRQNEKNKCYNRASRGKNHVTCKGATNRESHLISSKSTTQTSYATSMTAYCEKQWEVLRSFTICSRGKTHFSLYGKRCGKNPITNGWYMRDECVHTIRNDEIQDSERWLHETTT